MNRILVIEDDKAIVRGLADNLKKENFEVHSSNNGAQGYELAKKEKFELILLDVKLPGMNGYDICKNLRAGGVQTPILILTVKGEELDKVLGLELGADDYMTKPFSVRELVARIHAILRRQSVVVTELTELAFSDVYVDFKKQEATKGKKELKMSAKEFHLLKYFAEREGEVITRDKLLSDVWGYEATPTTRTVDNYILALRKKIESDPADPRHLITVHTAGYKFQR
ncbi:MAG: response regulator transcription factor [Ignavibacteriales bacterium]|nr:response regulator transcription factor [Ignavibacteriales bacterium]